MLRYRDKSEACYQCLTGSPRGTVVGGDLGQNTPVPSVQPTASRCLAVPTPCVLFTVVGFCAVSGVPVLNSVDVHRK